MTQIKHTPGPWNTSRDAVPDGYVQITVYAEGDFQRVATAFITEANAHLIAAPDLLVELGFIVDQWPEFEDDRPVGGADFVAFMAERWPELKAAVAKARGQT